MRKRGFVPAVIFGVLFVSDELPYRYFVGMSVLIALLNISNISQVTLHTGWTIIMNYVIWYLVVSLEFMATCWSLLYVECSTDFWIWPTTLVIWEFWTTFVTLSVTIFSTSFPPSNLHSKILLFFYLNQI